MRRRDLLAGLGGLGVLGAGGALATGAVDLGSDGVDPVELDTLDAPGSEAGRTAVPERGRVTFVEMFATWCTVCQSMMPRLAEVSEAVGDDVQFLSVTNEPVGTTVSREAVVEWWTANGGAWPVALDADLELTEQLNAGGVPYAVVFDERNRIVWEHRGRANVDELTERIRVQTNNMSAGLYGTVTLAIGAGAATFFAPCSYALLPGYVGYYVAATDREAVPLSGAVSRGATAAGGALSTFLLLGGLAAVAGDLIGAVLPAIELAVGGGLILFGVAVLAGKTGSLHVPLPKRRSSVSGFGLFGAVYALASAACVLPLFLALVVRSLTLSKAGTVAVLGVYGGVVAAMLLAATVAIAVGSNAGLDRFAAGSGRLVSVAGLLLIAAGIGQLVVAL